jgi:hypothetical protein
MKTVVMLMVLTVIVAITAVDSRSQSVDTVRDVKATPAYEMLIVKRAALRTEVVVQRQILASQHPDVQGTNYELSLVNIEIERMLVSQSSQISKLSRVYGDLLLRKIDLQVEEHQLRSQVTSTHPDLQKKRIEIAAIQQEIEDLLQ